MNAKKPFLRRALSILVLLLILISGVFLAGPRIDMSYKLQALNLPAAKQLDAYLAENEAQVPNLRPNTEKTIVWAGEPGQKTDYALVYFPGFSATRQETYPLSDTIAQKLGANLFYTRFTGHGRDGAAMAEATVNAWVNDVHEALEIGAKLGNKVVVVAVSTGASMATWAAAQEDYPQIAALALISPNYGTADPKGEMLAWPWGQQMAETLIGPERRWEPENEGERKYWTWAYPTRALMPMMGAIQLARSVNYTQFKTPILIIYSPQDQVVSGKKTEAVFAQMASPHKELWAYLESSASAQHVLAGDIKSPKSTPVLVDKILGFVRSLQ